MCPLQAVPLVIENPPAQPTLQVAAQTDELSEDPVQTIIDTPADLGCAPPAVSVTITGAPGNAEEFHATDKPSRALSAPVSLLPPPIASSCPVTVSNIEPGVDWPCSC